MSKFCIHCGAALPQKAKFCEACGHLVEGSPATTKASPAQAANPPPSKPRHKGVLIAVLGGSVGLCVIAAAVSLLLINRGVLPGLADLFGSEAKVETEIEVDAETLAALEESVDQLEAAFRAGDLATVIDLTHPAMRADYRPIFETHQAQLERVAELLATRELVFAAYDIAEYEVTEEGRTFSVTFEPLGDVWYLTSF